MAARARPTTADYSTIAISPAFIMVLVGSLAFFLLLVFYAGDFDARLRWIMGCFVFAAVLISRVSIEEGAERAALLGVALGLAVALALMRFTTQPLAAWLVLALIWWCASNLVWNCTLVDEDEDASGEGLLEAAGLDATLEATADQPTAHKGPAGEPSAAAAPSAWLRLWDLWRGERSRKAPPGLWVVYFSLAALPIFGLGQHFVLTEERQYAFRLVFYYVASALGLLITTSFLGLRRYLRQRGLEMPLEMAGTWLGVGAIMAAVMMFVAILVPRPNPEYAISSLSGVLTSRERAASQRAVIENSATKGESQSSTANEKKRDDAQGTAAGDQGPMKGETGADGTPTTPGQQGQAGDRPANDQQVSSDQQDSREQGKRDNADAESGKAQGERNTSADSTSSKSANAPASQPPRQQPQRRGFQFPSLSLGGWFLTIAKLVLYAVAIYFLVRHWSAVRAWLARLWQEFKDLWNRLFGQRPKQQSAETAEEALRPRARPFASFRDPFVSGEAARQPANRTVQYSFEALEAWAAERGWPRQEEETPLEFASRLATESPEMAADVRTLATLYARVAYARETLASGQLTSVERLWQAMQRNETVHVA